jgi:hypothetical protein
MATLVFGALGQALGGPIGAAIGALIGRQADGALFGPSARKGPRLRELEVTLSSYGSAIPRIHGRMRVPGAVIWATELQEHSETQGGGKGAPALTAYSYAANFAVALSSRPITGLGRIWADGKLLRGAAGDLKVGGSLRLYTGAEDQPPDPLIAASEGEARCPAFRGLAYVVFEGLELADFGNRLPALTFEVIADDAVRLGDILGETLDGVAVPEEIAGLEGFAVEDSVGASLATLDPVLPLAFDAAGDTIRVQLADGQGEAVPLGEAAAIGEDDGFDRSTGMSRRRAPPEPQPALVLRYLDVDRDYQPGAQHASGRAGPGEPEVVELPAALVTTTARALVDRMAFQRDRAREHVAWRTCALDAAVAPGTLVRLPDREGTWRVASWEWRDTGVELELVRVGTRALARPALAGEPFAAPVDLPAAPTRLVALELPGSGTLRRAAAVGASGANWSGAALYLDHGDGQLWPLGPAARGRAVVGTTADTLPAGPALLLDRHAHVTVVLDAADQALPNATIGELAQGANLALVGEELVHFARAEPLGDGHWRLSHFLRGVGGTEAMAGTHAPGEAFALVDARLTALDDLAGDGTVVALGRGDAEPVASSIHLAGIGQRPPAPVHGRARRVTTGGLRLSWTRRARGGAPWRDGVDVPLVEEAERYLVTYEQAGTAVRAWTCDTPELGLLSDELAELPAAGTFQIRQQGTHALSRSLAVPLPA